MCINESKNYKELESYKPTWIPAFNRLLTTYVREQNHRSGEVSHLDWKPDLFTFVTAYK